jgi:hypothetical protein
MASYTQAALNTVEGGPDNIYELKAFVESKVAHQSRLMNWRICFGFSENFAHFNVYLPTNLETTKFRRNIIIKESTRRSVISCTKV